MKYRIIIVATVLVYVLAVACSTPETELVPTSRPSSTPGPTPTESIPLTPVIDLGAAQMNWDGQGILNYEIEIKEVTTFRDQTRMIFVENGDVVEAIAECVPALADAGRPCSVIEFDPEEFTVAGLFKVAQSQLERDGGKWTTVELDGKYSFPKTIVYSNRELIDGWVYWEVIRFETKP